MPQRFTPEQRALTRFEWESEWAPESKRTILLLPGIKPAFLYRPTRSLGHYVYTDCSIPTPKPGPTIRPMELHTRSTDSREFP
jgi:hypothetical protein